MAEQIDIQGVELEESFGPFVVRWNDLVSTTNWEKGRIIFEWRESLKTAGAVSQEYTDGEWSRRVGTVSPQHVGRLRRVFDQFGVSRDEFPGLSWSHFQAALDWDDAEMWLEGAVQSKWSVSQMRDQRWQALGGAPKDKPREEEVVAAEYDEDAPGANDGAAGGPDFNQGPDFGDDAPATAEKTAPAVEEFDDDPPDALYADDTTIEPVRPFEDIAELPADMNEAVEMLKLSIIRHKMDGWTEVAYHDVLDVLDALKHLVATQAD